MDEEFRQSLDYTFDFLRDRDFTIDRTAWDGFCRDRHISPNQLNACKVVLLEELESTGDEAIKRSCLERLFCCDPFDLDNATKLRNLWHERSQLQLEPFQEWAYNLSLHLLQINSAIAPQKPAPIVKSSVAKTAIASPKPAVTINTKPTKPSLTPKSRKLPLWLFILFPSIGFIIGLGGAKFLIRQIPILQGDRASPEGNSVGKNPVPLPDFPLENCGDRDPGSVSTWYPVFVEYSETNLIILRRDYCRDAFPKLRKDSGALSIQVSSFTSRERAEVFAQIIGSRLGNAEVGEPSVR